MSSLPHLRVTARAGTGKTFTLVEGMKRVVGKKTKGVKGTPQQEAIWDAFGTKNENPKGQMIFVAFNKSIAEELSLKVPVGCDARTMHSFGYEAVRSAFQKKGSKRINVNGWRTANIVDRLTGVDLRKVADIDEKRRYKEKRDLVIDLVGLCKQTAVETIEDGTLDDLCDYYSVDVPDTMYEEVYQLTEDAFAASFEVDGEIDYSDMIWLPVVHDLPISRVGVMLVDEAQDLNRCQQELILKAADRVIFCGDPRQSIYGFAGADPGSMDRMSDILNGQFQPESKVVELSLTLTRRCPKAVVELAKRIVPDFEALPDAPEGKAGNVQQVAARKDYAPGDMLVCRANAPLVGEAYRLIKDGKPCRIQGRDFGRTLIRFIDKVAAKGGLRESDGAGDLMAAAEEYASAEGEKLRKLRNPNEQKIAMIRDQADCVMYLCDGQDTVADVKRFGEGLFEDKQREDEILLTSVHRAKGLEADRVFVLEPGMLPLPQVIEKGGWQAEQERNLQYVGYTRSKRELYFVQSPKGSIR